MTSVARSCRPRALVVIDPNNPGALYPDEVRRELIAIAEEHGLVVLADEVYGDLAHEGPVAPMATLDLDASIISTRACRKRISRLAGAPDGWPLDRHRGSTRRSPPSRSSPMGACAVPVRCSTRWRPALTGDRRIRRYSARHTRERASLTSSRLNAIEGMSCVTPRGAFYAMPKVALPLAVPTPTTCWRCYARPASCVHGSFAPRPMRDSSASPASPGELV